MKQQLFIDKYSWKLIIYYTINNEDKQEIIKHLKDSNNIESIKKNLDKADLDTGFTYSSFNEHCSIIVIHKASSIGEFINTIEHEKLHFIMHLCDAIDINPYSEEAAYLLGNVSQQILEEALCFVVEL